jgi:uncharacterized phage-associated protein
MSKRLEKLLHYVISTVPAEQLGATKLAKIIWFADVEHYRSNGVTLTQNDNYQKRDHGPLHVDFARSVDALKESRAIAERLNPTPIGLRREFLWLNLPDMAEFNGQELATIHRVIDQFRQFSAKQVSDLSRVEPWESANFGERLPVPAAAVQFGTVDDDDMTWAESEFDAIRETA